MSQVRKKKEIVYTIKVTVYTEFMEKLISDGIKHFVIGMQQWASSKGTATKFTYSKK